MLGLQVHFHREMNEHIEEVKTEQIDVEEILRDPEDVGDLIYSEESTYAQSGSLQIVKKNDSKTLGDNEE